MITKVEVFSEQPDAPELPLGGFMPNDDPLQLLDVPQGLGPVKADITSTQSATGRGEIPQGSSTGKRNIVMKIGFNPDFGALQTVASLRQTLYRYLLPEHWTKLRFYSDELPPVVIEGVVESVEPNIFSQDPEVDVSILCHKPDFVDEDATIYTGVVDDGTIEFEFDYIGTVDTGFELRVDATVDNPSYTGGLDITLVSQLVPQLFDIDPVTIDTAKYFKLNTLQSKKRVQNILVADGSLTNLLADVSGTAVWPQIKPGQNLLSVAAEETGQAWTLAFFNRFGGL